jgi:hypothetical protein
MLKDWEEEIGQLYSKVARVVTVSGILKGILG